MRTIILFFVVVILMLLLAGAIYIVNVDWEISSDSAESSTSESIMGEKSTTAIFESVGFKGWVDSSKATDQTPFVRAVFESNTQVERFELHGMRPCWRASTSTQNLLVRYLGVERKWSTWQNVNDVRGLPLMSAFELLAPEVGKDGNSSMAAYILFLPTSVIPNCNNKITETILDQSTWRTHAN